MKKFLRTLFVLALVVPLSVVSVACGGNKNNTPDPEQKDQPLDGDYAFYSFTILGQTFLKTDFTCEEGSLVADSNGTLASDKIANLNSELLKQDNAQYYSELQEYTLEQIAGSVEYPDATLDDVTEDMVAGTVSDSVYSLAGAFFFVTEIASIAKIEKVGNDYCLFDSPLIIDGNNITADLTLSGLSDIAGQDTVSATWDAKNGTFAIDFKAFLGTDVDLMMSLVMIRTGDYTAPIYE